MSQGFIQNWSHHVWENVVSNKVDRVLYNNNSEVNELMHDESHNLIIVVEIGGAKFDITIVDHWVYVSICVQYQVSLEINIKVLEDKLNLAVAWENEGIHLLHGIDLPTFDCREIKFDEG